MITIQLGGADGIRRGQPGRQVNLVAEFPLILVLSEKIIGSVFLVRIVFEIVCYFIIPCVQTMTSFFFIVIPCEGIDIEPVAGIGADSLRVLEKGARIGVLPD